MMRKIILALTVLFISVAPVSAMATSDACKNMVGNAGKSSVCGGGSTDLKTVVRNVINTLLQVVGVGAVVVIVYSGILYVISVGDSAKITRAKNTLMYAVVGLVVAIMSYAIVNFVIDRIVQ